MRGSTIGVTLGVYIGAGIFTLMVVTGYERAWPVSTNEDVLKEKKLRLLREADLNALHHKVYAAVGEDVWEGTVKPDFLHRVTLKTIQSTGNLMPQESQIIEWVRTHQQEARDLLNRQLPEPKVDLAGLLWVEYKDAPMLYEKK